MIVDGRTIAKKIEEKLKGSILSLPFPLGLSITLVGEHAASRAYIEKKKKLAERLGVRVFLHELVSEGGEGPLEKTLLRDAKDPDIHGMILQLPLPPGWNREEAIALIPEQKDVDVLTRGAVAAFREGKSPVLPPVVGAIQAILEEHHVSLSGKDVLIVGRGKLVGQPTALWMRHNDASVTMVGEETRDLVSMTREADIIVSGVGKPKLITKEMVKQGSILLDAGTSEDGGSLVGDIDPHCAEVAQLYSPVPGGIGPLTVVSLMKNLYILGKGSQ